MESVEYVCITDTDTDTDIDLFDFRFDAEHTPHHTIQEVGEEKREGGKERTI